MAMYNIIYYPPDGREGDEESMGAFDTVEEAGDVVAEDIARRTGLDLQLVEKVYLASRRYEVFPSDESEEDIMAKFDRAMRYAAMKSRLTE